MTTGTLRTVRVDGDYIYVEMILPEAAVKAGVFGLMEFKKTGDKYVGKSNTRTVRAAGGASCSESWQAELTLVSPDRIEGRLLGPPPNTKVDWNTCNYSQSSDWQSFTWIPVK